MTRVALFTTVGSIDDARRSAGTRVQRRWVACAQISET
jgi:uncharacterized protein involved in tolerance to divalent cations